MIHINSNIWQTVLCLFFLFFVNSKTVSAFYFPESEDKQWKLTRVQIDTVKTDGLQKADLNGDGKWELVVSGDDTGNVYWYEQLDNKSNWNRNFVAGGFQELEGVDAGDFDGDGNMEIIILEQRPGRIGIAKMDSNEPSGSWSTAILDPDAPMAQSSFVTDVSGNGLPDIIYTYDGLLDGEGGVYWLENLGGSPLDPNNWIKHEMSQINGGHGLYDGWVEFPDQSNHKAIIASTRLAWNADAVGMVFWLERPSDPREPWIRHTIVSQPSRHITVGDFNGNGQDNDVFTLRRDQGEGLYWYEWNPNDGKWTEHTVTTEGKYRTISSHDLTGNGTPEVLVVELTHEDNLHVYHKRNNGQFEKIASHLYLKSDDRIVYFDITGNGKNEIVTSSERHTLDYWILDSEQNKVDPVVTGYGSGLFKIGEEIYRNDFNNLDDWVVQIQEADFEVEPNVKVENNSMDVLMPGRGSTIWNKNKFSGPVAIVYNVVAPTTYLHKEGVIARDINCFWHASDKDIAQDVLNYSRYTGLFPTYDKQNGYYASIGGSSNTTTRFRRYPRKKNDKPVEHLALNYRDGQENYLIEPDRTYTIQLVVFGDIIQYIVDGNVYYEIREGDSITVENADGKMVEAVYTLDNFPPYTEGWFGFRLVRSHHIYSNFRVYRLEPAN